MPVNLNTAVTIASSGTDRAGVRKSPPQTPHSFAAPSRAGVNFIPSPDSLSTLIESAIAALRQGMYWDRGTMLNLLA